ncbi:MAG: hypothetical protein L0Z62_04080 [Gemmataceae bacterium]|nr:hypothetical protein [Gemmataceae bacterium]
MRWFLTGMTATVLALVGSGVAQACGCCCRGGGGGSCPSCPQQAAAYGAYRYWSGAYVCCQSCVGQVQRDPDTYLRKVAAERAGS